MQADSGPVLLIHARHSKTYGVQLADMFRVRVVQQADFPDVLIPKRDQNTQLEQVYFIRERPSAELIAQCGFGHCSTFEIVDVDVDVGQHPCPMVPRNEVSEFLANQMFQ